MADLKSQAPTQTLDVLGRVCPYPLVLTKKALEKMPSGGILKILCDALPRIPSRGSLRTRDMPAKW